jgi:hypothetical protein
MTKTMKKTTVKKVQRMPYIETKYEKSKDGHYLVHRTIITTVRPLEYFEKVISGDAKAEDLSEVDGSKTLEEQEVELLTGAEISS